MTPPLLQVTDFSLAYRVAGKLQPALQHITLQLAAGECYGLVGESGSGCIHLQRPRFCTRHPGLKAWDVAAYI